MSTQLTSIMSIITEDKVTEIIHCEAQEILSKQSDRLSTVIDIFLFQT